MSHICESGSYTEVQPQFDKTPLSVLSYIGIPESVLGVKILRMFYEKPHLFGTDAGCDNVRPRRLYDQEQCCDQVGGARSVGDQHHHLRGQELVC